MSKQVWITGGGSGLGAALALAHAENGWKVAISGRDPQKLQDIAIQHASISIYPLDISNLQQCQNIASQLQQQGNLQRVILNAGTCEYIDQGRIDASLFERVFSTNFQGTVNCLDVLLKQFCDHSLQIGVVSSISSLLPMPRAEAYGASKAALDYLVESLRSSLYASHLRMCLIQPGFVKTPLTDKNDFDMPGIMSAEKAAKIILSGMNDNQPIIRFPKRLHWPMRLMNLLPVNFRSRMLQPLTGSPKQLGSKEQQL